ncbi:MAG: complex I NDUFA9 subunit family protein, partial [Dongiaceae bacterium]
MNNFPYPTVTVFGASGFIGRYVVKRLAERGVVVRAVCRKAEHGKFLKPMGEVGQITPIGIDIHDAPALKAAVAGSDAVINLMGILYQKGRNRFDAVHHQAPKHIAEACRDFHVKRFIHISAIGANPNAKSLYAKSKGLGEADIVQAFPAATILRPSIVFGAEDNFFNLFASLARLSPVLPLIGGGHTKFQPVYVGDVA